MYCFETITSYHRIIILKNRPRGIELFTRPFELAGKMSIRSHLLEVGYSNIQRLMKHKTPRTHSNCVIWVTDVLRLKVKLLTIQNHLLPPTLSRKQTFHRWMYFRVGHVTSVGVVSFWESHVVSFYLYFYHACRYCNYLLWEGKPTFSRTLKKTGNLL